VHAHLSYPLFQIVVYQTLNKTHSHFTIICDLSSRDSLMRPSPGHFHAKIHHLIRDHLVRELDKRATCIAYKSPKDTSKRFVLLRTRHNLFENI